MTSKENETSKVSEPHLILIYPSLADAKKKAAQLAKRKEALKKLIKSEPKKASKSQSKAKTSKIETKSKLRAIPKAK